MFKKIKVGGIVERVWPKLSAIIQPIQKVWPTWLSARNKFIRLGLPVITFPLVFGLFAWNYKVNVYPGLPEQPGCGFLPTFMEGAGTMLASTSWFPSFIATQPKSAVGWFYSFWETLDYLLAFSMVLAMSFTVYAILKVLEIRARAIALGERSPGGAGVAGLGAASAIGVTLATCWGPALLVFIFGVNVISFSGSTEAIFQFPIPKPFVLLFVVAVVIGGMWWINHKEQVCELLEGERGG